MVLAHSVVTADGAHPERLVLFLHGILGRGSNWRSFARRLVAARPSWGAVLVDLRMHGDSQPMEPPHTVARAADDLVALEAALALPVRGVIGHSFGGKVALSYVAERGDALSHAFVLDATPGPRPTAAGSEATVAVVDFLSRVEGETWPSRPAFVARAIAEGNAPGLADWLAMNLAPRGDGLAIRLDLAAIRALLADYFARDLWPIVESPPGDLALHVVLGGRSRVFGDEDRARLVAASAAAPTRVHAHVLEDAGHWLHVDDFDGLFAVISASM